MRAADGVAISGEVTGGATVSVEGDSGAEVGMALDLGARKGVVDMRDGMEIEAGVCGNYGHESGPEDVGCTTNAVQLVPRTVDDDRWAELYRVAEDDE